MLLLDTEFIGDSAAVRMMVASMFAKLEPAALAGWMLAFVEPLVKEDTLATFVTESDPKGNPWEPLAPSTIENRQAEGYSEGPIQYRSGELYGYFQEGKSNINATQLGTELIWPGQAPDGDKLPFKVGSATYGNARTGAPPRPIIGLTLQQGAEITAALFEYLVGVRL